MINCVQYGKWLKNALYKEELSSDYYDEFNEYQKLVAVYTLGLIVSFISVPLTVC